MSGTPVRFQPSGSQKNHLQKREEGQPAHVCSRREPFEFIPLLTIPPSKPSFTYRQSIAEIIPRDPQNAPFYLIYKWEMVRTDVRWASHFTRELPFLKVIETHETTQTKGNLICMHHTRSECPRSPGTPLFGHVKFGFISWNRSSRRLIFQLSLKIILFRLEMFIFSDVNCFKVGSEHR